MRSSHVDAIRCRQILRREEEEEGKVPLLPLNSTSHHDDLSSSLSDSAEDMCRELIGNPKYTPILNPSIKCNPVCSPNPSSNSAFYSSPLTLCLSQRPAEWEADMMSYLAASRLCRNQVMDSSLLSHHISDDLWTSFSSLQKGMQIKKKKTKKMKASSVCKGLKKALCKQFMPFSIINNGIDKNVSTRILQARNNVLDTRKMESKELKGKGNARPDANANSELAMVKETAPRLSASRPVKPAAGGSRQPPGTRLDNIHVRRTTFFKKACGVALQVCDILNLD